MADPKQDALAAIEGLTLGDVLRSFYDRADDREKAIADMCDYMDLDFEVDGAIISEGDDNGAYVMGWHWVDFHGTKFDKYDDQGNLKPGVGHGTED